MNIIGHTPKERSRRLKIYSTVLILVALVSFYLPVVAQPNEARALDGTLGAILNHTLEAIKYVIRQARKVATDVAFKNGLKVYVTKFAEDTAVWVASAGKGQSPLYVTDPHYWTNLSDAAAGDFLDTAASRFGIDICKPVSTQQQYSVEGAVRALLHPENWCQNLCNREYKGSASEEFLVGASVGINVTSTLAGHEGTIQRIRAEAAKCSDPYDPVTCNGEDILGPYICSDYPLGSCLEVYEADVARYKQTQSKDLQRCMNLCSAQKRVARCTATQAFSAFNAASFNGINAQKLKGSDFLKSVTYYYEPGENDIGQLVTLAEKARNAAEKAVQEFRDTSESKTQPLRDPVTGKVKTPADITGGAAQEGLTKDPSGKIFSLQTGSPLADAIGVFTSTLTRRLLQRIFERGFNPAAEPQNLAIAGNVVLTGAQAARELFATVAVPDFRTDTGQSTTLDELVACPDSNAGPSNCVLDDKFRQAIDQGLTVEEALKAGLLDGRKLFGYKLLNTSGESIEPDFREGYPYRSLIMLRRLRVIPVGWELAAQAIKKGGSVTSLQTLVDSFGRCGPAAEDYSPFCG
ncbi:MAG: hypothetical protein HY566_00450, partial [Candidatus Kerfeldbacteria bacterium]|nr:hypothetical protein [Candidatus Kerfeldbacteria bacterium]